MLISFDAFETALNEAVSAIVELREQAESIRNTMDEIVEACETIESEL